MTGFLDQFLAFLLGFGVVGIGVLAVLDSTIIFFLPFALDALIIILISRHRDRLLLYVVVAIIGSVIGCAITYFVMRKASRETIEKKVSKRKMKRVKKKIEKGGFFGLVIASLLPPPFPFTPFVVAAAVSELSVKKTFGAIITGRTARYFAEGALALLFARKILHLLDSRGFKIFMLSLFVLAVIGTAFTIYKWVRK